MRSFKELWNMNFGFLGIQFGWGLQMANMSAIYEYLGAHPEQIPLLWLAAPLTGLLVQPLIGHLSDHTWCRLGRRRPYFLVGAILSCLALLAMPHCTALWMAAALLWILDSSINVSMEPFRAFVADQLPESERTRGFAMQSLFIGLGAVAASAMPWLLTHVFHVVNAPGQTIPQSVTLSFYTGAVVFLTAILWTIFTTSEQPPKSHQAAAPRGPIVAEVMRAIREMPEAMRQLAGIQMLTWLGLFCMWLYFPVAVAHNVFGAVSEKSPQFTAGVEWAGMCFAGYSAVTFLFSFLLPTLAERLGRPATHACCLAMGAAGLISVSVIHNPNLLLLSMVGIGIAWASILSMPYAMLSCAIPQERMGIYMGIFNFFIVIPEILASLFFGFIMTHWLHDNRLIAVVIGGVSMLVAGGLTLRITDRVESVQALKPEPQPLPERVAVGVAD
ncbi:MAG: MFS transporter [Candidatus Xenobia bacterium]